MGAKDVLLLEQNQLAGGTTWHAAGMVGRLRTSQQLDANQPIQRGALCRAGGADGISNRLATGWQPGGGHCQERMVQLHRTAAMAGHLGVEAAMISADQAQEKWPLMQTEDIEALFGCPGMERCFPRKPLWL